MSATTTVSWRKSCCLWRSIFALESLYWLFSCLLSSSFIYSSLLYSNLLYSILIFSSLVSKFINLLLQCQGWLHQTILCQDGQQHPCTYSTSYCHRTEAQPMKKPPKASSQVKPHKVSLLWYYILYVSAQSAPSGSNPQPYKCWWVQKRHEPDSYCLPSYLFKLSIGVMLPCWIL